ncbi:hypothetical protein GLYMA_08G258850v4 [Glycine max]|nr:hypothetical protein GLYMA_08G258850v4 [Glycine max]KAH1053121.1 hypothetical protein GYH30_022422 [Glycine max]
MHAFLPFFFLDIVVIMSRLSLLPNDDNGLGELCYTRCERGIQPE